MIRFGSIVCGFVVLLAGAGGAAGQVTSRVSLGSNGAQGNADSYPMSLSADGRYVAMYSLAGNLVAGDTNGAYDVFVRDRYTGTTERVSVDSAGVQGNGTSVNGAISADGRYVAFESFATNLVAGDTNAVADIFVHDRQTGTTERVSIDSSGTQGNDASLAPSISGDGRYVAFVSPATNLVFGDTNGLGDVFVRDRPNATTERVSVSSAGAQGNNESYASWISADGRYAIFASYASNLVTGDANGAQDVFLRDRQSGTTERISVDSNGTEGNGASFPAAITPNGRYVAFQSDADNLVTGDANGFGDAFVRDRSSDTTELVSRDSAGAQGNAASWFPLISADGRIVAFYSSATNLVSGDTNATYDAFVRDRAYAPFTSSCHPGAGGVIACPCSNPPGALGRGCNNSSGTGGAILSASGIAYLSQDTLVFTTSGEKPTALSILAQWIGANATGVVFGQGVRCTSGTFKRLFSKNAVAGSITVPNFGAGDPSVSARSAAKGDTILAGQSRWYVVYYRDNVVLGGCPAASNFNATQTGQVTWSP